MKYSTYKKIGFIFLLFFLLNHVLYSQDENNKWVVGIGINTVEIRTPEKFSGLIKDYGDFEDINMSGAFIRVFAGKYLTKGLTLQISTSANKIQKGYDYNKGDVLSNDSFFVIDTKVKYDLNRLVGETSWFDPFVLIGAGYSKIGSKSSVNTAAGWGFNLWFSETVGLNFQSDYNHHPLSWATDYFQHSLGIVYTLNIRRKFNWSK